MFNIIYFDEWKDISFVLGIKPKVLLKSLGEISTMVKGKNIDLKFGPLFFEPVARIKNAEVYPQKHYYY